MLRALVGLEEVHEERLVSLLHSALPGFPPGFFLNCQDWVQDGTLGSKEQAGNGDCNHRYEEVQGEQVGLCQN